MESTRGEEISWQVKGFYRPAYHVLGPGGLFKVLVLSFVLLTPGLGFGFYCVWSAQYAALAWAFPLMLAVLMSGPAPNGIGLALWVIVLCIGLVCAVFSAPVHAVGGFLPGLTWLTFSALQGTTMIEMDELLRESSDAKQRLRTSGVLIGP